MRYIIAGATAFALIAGIALGFVVSRGLDGSASAAPKAQAVEEQNLDAGGFIAVHEQGTADVNVVSMPERTGGRTILVAENVSIPAGGNLHTTNFVATADCRNIQVFVERTGSVSQAQLNLSADGITTHGIVNRQTVENSGAGEVAYFQVQGGMPIVSPHTSVSFFNNSSVNPLEIAKAWLYCVP